jgi:hypothetical protein
MATSVAFAAAAGSGITVVLAKRRVTGVVAAAVVAWVRSPTH